MKITKEQFKSSLIDCLGYTDDEAQEVVAEYMKTTTSPLKALKEYLADINYDEQAIDEALEYFSN